MAKYIWVALLEGVNLMCCYRIGCDGFWLTKAAVMWSWNHTAALLVSTILFSSLL